MGFSKEEREWLNACATDQERYRIDVDNDIVFVTDQEKDECVFDFDDYGQDFIVKALRFMGCNAQPV